jgi:winged helix DNA-binding protein
VTTTLTTAALNRALLARQGLLERLDAPLPKSVEAIGALQAQQWNALPVALASRVDGFAPDQLHDALEGGDVLAGTLLRGTLHLVSAREHPAYAAVADASRDPFWRRTDAEPGKKVDALLKALLAYAAKAPRSGEEIAAFLEEWIADHPDALDADEVEQQRKLNWRPFLRWSAFVRVPADGRWGAKAPSALRAAPSPRQAPAKTKELNDVVRRHLRAFGPATADDVASWIGWRAPQVRPALDRLKLERFEDERGRMLYDLPGAPRPDPDTPAPPRLLAAFDSVLLAYDSKRRARILPDRHRDAVYERRNLRIKPSYLVDGLVAGTWSLEVKRREATVTLQPLQRLTKAARTELVEEAERVARSVQPEAKAHRVAIS